MEQDNFKGRSTNNKIVIGLLLITGGVLLFINKTDSTVLPNWLFTWPCLIILIGVVIGLQNNFKNSAWMFLIFWGGYSLVDQQIPSLHLKNYTAPLALILIGLFFLFRRKHKFPKRWDNERWNNYQANSDKLIEKEDGEFVNITSVFSGSKKIVFSKNFKGGDVTCFMGGAEIDLTQADIQGKAVIDATCVFGGIKIIVPSNWDVKLENTAAFGSIEDKRRVQNFAADSSKLLVIAGTAVFGGIDITNY